MGVEEVDPLGHMYPAEHGPEQVGVVSAVVEPKNPARANPGIVTSIHLTQLEMRQMLSNDTRA
jgi:hypothetical protein